MSGKIFPVKLFSEYPYHISGFDPSEIDDSPSVAIYNHCPVYRIAWKPEVGELILNSCDDGTKVFVVKGAYYNVQRLRVGETPYHIEYDKILREHKLVR